MPDLWVCQVTSSRQWDQQSRKPDGRTCQVGRGVREVVVGSQNGDGVGKRRQRHLNTCSGRKRRHCINSGTSMPVWGLFQFNLPMAPNSGRRAGDTRHWRHYVAPNNYCNAVNCQNTMNDRSFSKCASIDGVGFLIWHLTFKTTVMTSARRSLPASPPCACDVIGSLHVLQFLIHSTFVLVLYTSRSTASPRRTYPTTANSSRT